ncbi:MAG: ATP-binding cassette domain-containing protein [Thermomicrobiales bacterium]|nr:ATP-binding cassette domain-containing protein [Thermomicrobiales bacterium]
MQSDPQVDAVIRVQNLTKTYTFHQQQSGLIAAIKSLFHRQMETRLAVDAISFAIRRGEVVGFLGPNGAGKTTTLKMLSGLLYPTSGELSVLGHIPQKRASEYLRRISLVMGQKTMLWWDVTPMDTLLLHKDMYGLSDDLFQESVAELTQLLDVADLLHVQVRKLSLGQRMRMELMVALLHRPEIVFLDEPTIGLDVVAKANVRTFLAELNRTRGTTIIITSHDMDDIEALCERVIMIDHGRIQFDGRLPDLVQRMQPRKLVRVAYAAPVSAEQCPEGARFEDEDGTVLVIESLREELAGLLQHLGALGDIQDLSVNDADLDDVLRDFFTNGGEVRS